MLPKPGYSYLHRTGNLARELVSSGYNVTVILKDGPIKGNIIKDFALVDVLISDALTKFAHLNEEFYKEVIHSGFRGSNFEFLIQPKFKNMCFDLALDETLLGKLRQKNFDIAIVNMADYNTCASVIPYKLSIPFIREEVVPRDAGRLVNPAVYPTNYLFPTTDKMSYMQRLANTLFYIFWFVRPDILSPPDAVGTLAPEMPPITNEKLRSMAKLYLINHDEIVDYHMATYPDTIPVGGLNTRAPKQLNGELKSFMDSAGHGVVIVSFGSVAKWMPDNIKDKLLIAFKKLQFLKFIFKHGNNIRVEGNILLMPWIPQNDILGHRNTKLFITHCGINSIYDALYNAVPVIGFPLFGDQHYNAMKMTSKGYGIKLSIADCTSEDLIVAIQTLLNNTTYKQSILNASAIFKSRPMTPAQRAAWWIDHVIKYGASHLHPPIATLPLYQVLLVDVVAGGLAIFAVIVYFCQKVIRLISKVFRVKHLKSE